MLGGSPNPHENTSDLNIPHGWCAQKPKHPWIRGRHARRIPAPIEERIQRGELKEWSEVTLEGWKFGDAPFTDLMVCSFF